MKTINQIAEAAVAKYEHDMLRKHLPPDIRRHRVDLAAIAARIAIDEVQKNSLDGVLDAIRDAGAAKNIAVPVQQCVAAARRNEDPERSGFAQEMAMQYGFAILDDEAEIYGVTAERLTDMMSVLGFRTTKERQNAEGDLAKLEEQRNLTKTCAVGTRPGHADVAVVPGYRSLLGVLIEALNQAQYGKGAERHNLGGDLPFERQRMQQISELIGSVDGMSYQACKKITEGVKLPTLDRQVAELLGAINYIAGMIIFLRKRDAEEKTNGFYRVQLGEPHSGRETNQNIASATETLEKIATNLGIEPADLKKPWVDPVERMFGSFEDQLAAQEAKYPAIREHNDQVRAARRNPLEWRNHAGDKMPSTITPTTLVEVSYGDDRRSRGPVQAKAGDVDWSSIIEWRFSPKIVPAAAGPEAAPAADRPDCPYCGN